MGPDRKYNRYCGQRAPFYIESDRKFFRVTFHSNSRHDATGFRAEYRFIPKSEGRLFAMPDNDIGSDKPARAQAYSHHFGKGKAMTLNRRWCEHNNSTLRIHVQLITRMSINILKPTLIKMDGSKIFSHARCGHPYAYPHLYTVDNWTTS